MYNRTEQKHDWPQKKIPISARAPSPTVVYLYRRRICLADTVPSPLAALAVRAQSGDRKAFELLVHHTARLVYAHIVASVRDRQKAEDLTQETFVAAWKGIGSLAIGPAASRERNAGEGGEGRERDG